MRGRGRRRTGDLADCVDDEVPFYSPELILSAYAALEMPENATAYKSSVPRGHHQINYSRTQMLSRRVTPCNWLRRGPNTLGVPAQGRDRPLRATEPAHLARARNDLIDRLLSGVTD